MSMLQAVSSRAIRSGSLLSTSSSARTGASRAVANNKPSARRITSLGQASLHNSKRIGLAKYSTQPPKHTGDQEQVWEDIDGINDFYDPRFDSDFPEEEGWGGQISDEEYARLLGLVKGATEQRFPPGAYSNNDRMAVPATESLIDAAQTTTQKVKANSLEGTGASERLRIGTLQLPGALLDRIRDVLKDYPRAWLKRDAEALSETLRARTVEKVTGRNNRRAERESGKLAEEFASKITLDATPIEYNKHQAMAYVAHRIPGIFSCNTKVFDEIHKRFPGFAPKRMMDFGSGPGTTTWAASQMWPSIRRYQLVEPSESMVEVSTKILDGFPVERRNFLHQGRPDRFDLIVASYSLSELNDDSSRRLHILSIWEHLDPGGLLIVVEPGTPIGFKVVRQARSALLELGQTVGREAKPQIIGPCPHAHRCPMSQTTWCHFIQRVERSATLRSTKSGSQNWENEKFSYVAISKGPLPGEKLLPEGHPNKDLKWSRLIRQPLKRGGHVLLDVCLPTGTIERITVSKKYGKDLYTAARKSTWGDVFYIDHVVDAEARISENPRRKWRERDLDAKAAKAAAKADKTDVAADILSAELERLDLPK